MIGDYKRRNEVKQGEDIERGTRALRSAMLLPKSEYHSIENAKEAKTPCLPGSVLFHISCFFADPIGIPT
jgi:hypothetical protein